MLFVVLFLIAGCTDYALKQTKEPSLVVYPSVIDFGNINVLNESGTANFAVINAGDNTLNFTLPTVSSGDRFFMDDGLGLEYSLPPGEYFDFNVYYHPLTHESNEGIITLTSDDIDMPEYVLPLIGVGDAPVLNVDPVEADFGTMSIGCEEEQTITLSNQGNIDLVIESLSQMVTQPTDIIYDLGSLTSPPWVLLPGQAIDIGVTYSPSDVSLDASEITITSNDPLNPGMIITQAGEGITEQFVTDVFIQTEIRKADVIFVVDNSGSMRAIQSVLANQMSNFLNIFMTTGTDYHIGFITTDNSSLINYQGYSWVSQTHPDPVTWAEDVISSIGTWGSGNEMGIMMASYALQQSAGPISSFWRDDAVLVVIYISDEPDYSSGTWYNYIQFFDNIKHADLHMQFAVIGDYPSGCAMSSASNRNIAFGEGYYEMTLRYNGDWYSICAPDWGIQMQNMALEVSGRLMYELSSLDPIETSIVVFVNGQIVDPSNWRYNSSSNSVIFEASVAPESGETIEIEYSVWGCSE